MKPRWSIRCAWCRRAISFCRARLWRGCIILSSTLAALLVVSWFTIEWTPDGAETYPGGTILRDNAGNVLRVSLGPGDVDCRPGYLADPEDWIVKALIASEDSSYWTHGGVRPLSILRAAFQNVFYGRRISGASTITMQAVRLIHPHPKSLWWKYKEAVMALKLERQKDKRWILSQYLNRAPFGSNFIGIEAAANGWFGKSAKQLGIGEAAMLAGMVQAPSRFRPDRGYERAFKRRDYVLSRMLKTGVITEDQMEAARSVRPVVCRAPRPFKYPYFCDWYMAEFNERRARRARPTGNDGRARSPSAPPGDITTTLDADIQEMVEKAVNSAAEKGGLPSVALAKEGYSVAAVVMKVDTGDVLALTCSGDYFDAKSGQVNTALAPRPAGSTLKPFLTALAMDGSYITPATELLDAPRAFKGYHPANFDGAYRGPVSVRDALILSLNIPFVQLLERMGVERFGACLRSLGFEHMTSPDADFGLGMAIGNVEVTLMELVQAYGVIARGGTKAGRAGAPRTPPERVYSPGASYLISDMLSGEERSRAALGHVADVPTSRFAWKTGTSAAYRDAWTVLWNPEYVVGVWCGHKSGGFGDQTLVGAKAAAPVAWTIARSLYPQDNGPWFVEPADAERLRTQRCHENWLRPSALTILKPEDKSHFILVSGMSQQRLVCRANRKVKLWWYVDGHSSGTTDPAQPFVTDMSLGDHTLTCSTAEGETASISVSIQDK